MLYPHFSSLNASVRKGSLSIPHAPLHGTLLLLGARLLMESGGFLCLPGLVSILGSTLHLGCRGRTFSAFLPCSPGQQTLLVSMVSLGRRLPSACLLVVAESYFFRYSSWVQEILLPLGAANLCLAMEVYVFCLFPSTARWLASLSQWFMASCRKVVVAAGSFILSPVAAVTCLMSVPRAELSLLLCPSLSQEHL